MQRDRTKEHEYDCLTEVGVLITKLFDTHNHRGYNDTMTPKQFEQQYMLLMIQQPQNIWNDREWLLRYEQLVDTLFLTQMSQGVDESSFIRYIEPYLLQPWHTEIHTDLSEKYTLTPSGIHKWLHLFT